VYTQRTPATGLTGTINSNRDATSDTIKASVDVFEGDFGRLSLIPSQFLHAGVNPYTIKEETDGTFSVYDGVTTDSDNQVNVKVTWSGETPTITPATLANYATEADAKKHVNLHAQNAKCKGFIIPWEYLEIRYGGNIAQVRELTENGGGPRRMMEAMAALVVQSPLCFGMMDYKANDA
jgi:hypothetical protein